jgi:hypothetical protein
LEGEFFSILLFLLFTFTNPRRVRRREIKFLSQSTP